jgi:hypothetical protein
MFEWPLDKLALINSALAQTANNLVAAADDGSEEWMVCSPTYERALGFLIEQHPWSWARTMTTLQPAANAPTDPMWDTAYNLPADIVHLIYVRIEDLPCIWQVMMGPPSSGSRPQICVNAQGGPPAPVPPQVPAPVTIAYISSQTSDPQFATPTLVLALEAFVIAGIYRGLHEDASAAATQLKLAEEIVARAQSRHDQQMPKRAIFNSRMRASRVMRRPWPPFPAGWSGTSVAMSVGGSAGPSPPGPPPSPPAPPPIVGGTLVNQEALAVTGTNVLTPLSTSPAGDLLELVVNGQTFASEGPSAPFTVSGTMVLWNPANAGFSLTPSDIVVAIYSHT